MTTSLPGDELRRTPAHLAAAFTEILPALDGHLVLPQDPGWDEARTAWQLTVDQRPAAVVLASSARDVAGTVRAARRAGLRVAVQATGHNAGPLGPLHDTVLLRTSAMDRVDIDRDQRTARVGAGALWGEVTDAAAAVGLAALAGSARDVGVVGYTLGGGLSWFARSHGLAANHVTAAEVVTADGALRHVDARNDPDLFWAIRGGGGSFGVVTALEFRLFPITEVQAGALFWPIERAAEVLHAWRTWVAGVPDAVTSLGRILRFPPIPDIPEPLRGRSLVGIELVSQLDAAATAELLAPLRALAPEMDGVGPTPVAELGALHMDPPGPVPVTGDGLLLADLPAEALDAYLAAVGPDVPCPFLTTELRHLGGAVDPGRFPAGAVPGLDARFVLYSGSVTPAPELAHVVHAALAALHGALAPWAAATAYLNFTETSRPAGALFDAQTHQRLQAVKSLYDAGDVIRANHPVRPAESPRNAR